MTSQGNDIAVGSRVGRLTLTDRIGHGGFSVVYRAYDEALDADVAVKVLADNHSLDPEIRARFLAEGRVLRKVSHPSLIQIYDVGETDAHRPYLVLQLASGGTLAERLSNRKEADQSVTTTDLIAIVDGLEGALTALHDLGIVHRDVSPSNIFIMQPNAVKSSDPDHGGQPDDETNHNEPLLQTGERFVLGDLGLAKDLGATSGITVGGGTPQFAAPEQLQPASVVTPTADMYAASMLLRWAADNSSLSPVVEELTANSVKAEPEERPQTVAKWADDIRLGLAEHHQQSDNQISPPSAANRSRRGGLAAVGLACVALFGLAFWAWTVSDPTTLASTDSENLVSLAVNNSTVVEGWDNQSWSYQSPLDKTGTIEFASFGALSLVADDPIDVPSTARLVGVIRPADASVAVRVNDETFRPCPLAGSVGMTSTNDGRLRFEIPSTALGTEIETVNRISLINTKDDPLSLQVIHLALEVADQEDGSGPAVCGP